MLNKRGSLNWQNNLYATCKKHLVGIKLPLLIKITDFKAKSRNDPWWNDISV